MLSTVRVSLRTKLIRTMIALVIMVASATVIAVAALSYVSSRATLSAIESHLRANIQHKGNDLVSSQALALRDLVADNAFGDVSRLVDRTVERDTEVVYGLYLDEDLKPWRYATRKPEEGHQIPREWRDLGIDPSSLKWPGITVTTRSFGGKGVFEFATPVLDDKGAFLGSLRYAISDGSLRQALESARDSSRRAMVLAVGLLLLVYAGTTLSGLFLARRAASRVTRPVGELIKAVNALAAGSRDTRVSIDSGDEIELLGRAFNHMVSELQESYAQLEQMNRTLESKVAARTRELARRNDDMRLVLDNVEQGFLTLAVDGTLGDERSAIVDTWFAPYPPQTKFCDYMAGVDPVFSESFLLGYEALIEEVLPRELCIEQLPTRIRHGGRELLCTYLVLGTGERFEGLLIVIDDVTAELLAARKEAERGEILATFEALARDRGGFLEFMDEAGEQIARLASADLEAQKRILHTLKGNTSLMGLDVVASVCHRIEDEVAETCMRISQISLAALERRWQELTKALRGFLGENGRDVVEVPSRELELLDEEIRAMTPAARILDRIASWRLEPAERPLTRLANHARALTSRLGKGDLAIVIEGGDVRLSPKHWAGLWSDLLHVVRNAVDHGFEPTSVRLLAGKPARPQLRLHVGVAARQLSIEIEDDGGGIDWPAVRRAAAVRGLPTDSADDLVRALFADELTTRAEITTLSGRGVGLAAVRQQVERLGGTFAVESRVQEGTCFRFTIPLSNVGPRFGVEVPAGAAPSAGPPLPRLAVGPLRQSSG